jgi:hypothetical protein
MSPASGDTHSAEPSYCYQGVSIQLMSPASGDIPEALKVDALNRVSIQLMSPASGDDDRAQSGRTHYECLFPFN